MSKLNLIYKDQDILVINKEAGMLSIPDRYDPLKPNLYSLLERKYGKVWTVHRLDKDTSGVILFALNEQAHRALSMDFEDRKVDKIYHAFVHGKPPLEEGKIEVDLTKRQDGKMLVSTRGKRSVSYFRIKESFQYHSLLELKLLTGRTHQARVHCQYLGCPLIVDSLYGGDEGFYVSSIKRNYSISKGKEERPLISRTPLHAARLSIQHPQRGEKHSFEAEWPKDLRALHNQLQKWSSVS